MTLPWGACLRSTETTVMQLAPTKPERHWWHRACPCPATGRHVNLMVAASHGNVEMIDLLVSAGASIDARTGDGFTALLHAASLGYREACERLLALGADPAARNDHGYASWDLAMDWQLGALLKAAGE